MWRRALLFLVIVLAGAGCVLVPPRKLPIDRENYLDAVSTSWKEQLLTNLVRLRYGDALTTLEMTSINTTYALDSNLSANYPISWDPLHSTYPQGNWVDGFRNMLTLGGTVTYQDHPSIAYSPMRGEALAKTMIEPIPPAKLLKSLQTGWAGDYIFPCCVRAINNLHNGTSTGKIKEDPNFLEVVWLFAYLKKYGVIRIAIKEPKEAKVTKVPEKYEITLNMTGPGKKKIVSGEEPAMQAGNRPQKGKETGETTSQKDKGTKDSASGDETKDKVVGELVIDTKRAVELDKNPDYYLSEGDKEDKRTFKYMIQRFKDLLWSPDSPPRVKEICEGFDVYQIIDGNQNPPQDPDCEKIVLQTRSIYETLTMLSMFIDMPSQELPANGNGSASPSNLVTKSLNGQEGKNQKKFIVYSDKSHPSNAFVAVKQHGYWFYIKDSDFATKDMFTSTEVFLSMFETGTSQGTPLLTLPVQ
ncbi:MAG: hypothetical protein ABSC45_11700 [Desulfobaccales bacterium]|jgi:hypothetical protein